MVQRDDVEEHYDEDPDGEEEDKDDGSTHATAVADLAETTKLKGGREALESERRNQTNQAKTTVAWELRSSLCVSSSSASS